VEFTQSTPEHHAAVEKFLGVLSENRSLLPELFVEPEGLEAELRPAKPAVDHHDDPLLQLFYGEPLPVDDFQAALRRQRATPSSAAAHA
jgi:hypothetical protein